MPRASYISPGFTRVAFSHAGSTKTTQILHVGDAPVPALKDVPKLEAELKRLIDLYAKDRRARREPRKEASKDQIAAHMEQSSDHSEWTDDSEIDLGEAYETEIQSHRGQSSADGDALSNEELSVLQATRQSRGVAEVTTKAHLQDVLADEALREYTGCIGASAVSWKGQIHSVTTDSARRGSCAAVVSRISSLNPHPALVAIEHIKNHLVMVDYIQTWQQHVQQHPTATPLLLPTTFNSFVLCQPSWYPIPAYHHQDNTATETQFIAMAEQATIQGRQLISLNRGKPGHSTFPNVYRPLAERLVNLHMRVAYALRQNFVNHANCALPMIWHNRPFQLDVTVPSARGLLYTELVNIRLLVDEFMMRTVNLKANRINSWDWEETCARIAGYPQWLSNLIKYVRGYRRNRIVP